MKTPFDALNTRERIVLIHRLNGATLESIASTLKLTRERIRQIENKGLQKIVYRKCYKSKHW